MIDIVIDWNLAWTIAFGIVFGSSIMDIFSLLGKMWQLWQDDGWVAILVPLHFIIVPAAFLGAYHGYFGWFWLIPAFIVSAVCYFVATDILVKKDAGFVDEDEEESNPIREKFYKKLGIGAKKGPP